MATAFAEAAARHADSPEGSATVDLRRKRVSRRVPSVATGESWEDPPKAMLIVAGAELVVVFSLPEKRIGISSPPGAQVFSEYQNAG
jgi:hypothetical protein